VNFLERLSERFFERRNGVCLLDIRRLKLVVKIHETTTKSIAIMSDNDLYRYQLTRSWNDDKQKATVIMLNPSKADMLKTDRTVMNVNNFMVDSDYGSMTIVNLFAYMTTDPKLLTQRDNDYESLNNDYLVEAFKSSDVIVVAWTRSNHINRKREVERLLQSFQEKVKCFADETGKKPRHPRDLGESWTLEDYVFEFN